MNSPFAEEDYLLGFRELFPRTTAFLDSEPVLFGEGSLVIDRSRFSFLGFVVRLELLILVGFRLIP